MLIAAAVVAVLVAGGLGLLLLPESEEAPAPTASSSPRVTGPTAPTGSATPTPTQAPGPREDIAVSNLTSGIEQPASGPVTTESFDVPADTLVIAHVFSFEVEGAEPPSLESDGLDWELIGGIEGQKRHWLYRAVGPEPASGPVTITFANPDQGAVMWVFDAVAGAETGGNGADAIAQFVPQESQANASSGELQIAPLSDPGNALGCFVLAGSGAASTIVPPDGFQETGEVTGKGSNLMIASFWTTGQDVCSATFVDDDEAPQIQSWTFLAAEIRAAPAGA